MNRLILLLLSGLVLVSCSKKDDVYLKWSENMAFSVMTRHDSLVKAMPNRRVWAYDYAVLANAIGRLSDMTGDARYYRYMKEFMDYYVQADGSIRHFSMTEYNLDKIRPAVSLFRIYDMTGNEKYKKALDSEIQQLETHPRTNDGGFWHKKVYPYQMWLDGIYMASPFMVQYASVFNDPRWFDEAEKQITQIYAHTRDEKTGLLYHAWDESRQQRWCDTLTGRSKHFWSRAMGWYTMAITDVLDFMPKNHPGRAKLINILNETSSALVRVQDDSTGLWYQVLDMGGREGNYTEASGTSMFIYTFAKGVRMGYLPESFLEPAKKAFEGLTKNLIITDNDGHYSLTRTCGGCGLGGNPYRDGSYEYYINEKVVLNDPKGLGPFILAGIEMSMAVK